MAVFRMIRPKPVLTVMKFDSYNQAIEFCRKSALLEPSKPYRKLSGGIVNGWCVTIPPKASANNARFIRVS